MSSDAASSAPDQGLADLMRNLSTHLENLARKTDVIEQVVSQHLLPLTLQQPTAIIQLQNLDYLRQCLDDLAKLTLVLSKSNCCGAICAKTVRNLQRELTLQDTKALVGPTSPSGALDRTENLHGTIDLF